MARGNSGGAQLIPTSPRHGFAAAYANATDVRPVKKVNPRSMVLPIEKPVELGPNQRVTLVWPGMNGVCGKGGMLCEVP